MHPQNPGTASIFGLVSSASYINKYEVANGTAVYTWHKPSWAKTVTVVAIGGGGGGGGARNKFAGANSYATGGAGGAGGEITIQSFNASDLPATVTVAVGSGGQSVSGNSQGGNAGNSTFGTLVLARGGIGGANTSLFNNTIGKTSYTQGRQSKPWTGFGSGWGGRGVVSDGTGGGDAPSLPMRDPIIADPNVSNAYPWLSVLTPTGGGGGAGMNCSDPNNDCIVYYGRGAGGAILPSARNVNNTYTIEGVVDRTYQRPGDSNVPAYYTLVGLGGRGGESGVNAEDGGLYGGGGGGARTHPTSGGTFFPSGKGGDGVVVVISEA